MAIDVESIYRRYGPMVVRRCQHLLRDTEEAWDAMQDVFVNLLRHEQRLQDAGLSSLLHRIATNVCLNRLRARKRRPEDKDEELLATLAALDVDHERQTSVLATLRGLFGAEPESTATMAVLHWVDGMTLAEVAREVGMSVSGVRKRLRGVQARVPVAEVP